MVSVDLVRFGIVFAVLGALAVLVKCERRLSRWLIKSPRRRRRKAVGLEKTALLWASAARARAKKQYALFQDLSFPVRGIGFMPS